MALPGGLPPSMYIENTHLDVLKMNFTIAITADVPKAIVSPLAANCRIESEP